MASVSITPSHAAYLRRGIIAIVHWGPNTFTDQEWGYGDTDPGVVQPSDLDPAQWVKAMKAGGVKAVVLVAKHHDGFCLWPSALNREYSTAALKGKLRNVDVVGAVKQACRVEGLDFGVYLSPWDRRQANYGTEAYVAYFHAQWAEVFAQYGPVSEIWLDGANGGDGYYGGACERRSIPEGYYCKPRLLEALVKHNPRAVAFGGNGANSVAWCGNEDGESPEDWRYEMTGEDGKPYFMPPEADTPLRKGWFFHPGERPKSLRRMVDTYFNTVGRGAVLNWGIAPDRRGLVCDDDVSRLREFGDYVRAYESVNLADGAAVSSRTDGRITVHDVRFTDVQTFNSVDFAEDLSHGQLAVGWKVEVAHGSTWKAVAVGGTVGWRRLARFPEETASAVRVTCTGDRSGPRIVNVAVRTAPPVADDGSRQ